MTLGASPIAATPIAAAAAASSSSGGIGALAPFSGFGTQGEPEFRGVRFWANETQSRFVARESDGDEMLGTTDKDPTERVWYEFDFIDLLKGASILSVALTVTPGLSVVTYETVSNGESVHLLRMLAAGGGPVGSDFILKATVSCSDGSIRARSLKIRSKEL